MHILFIWAFFVQVNKLEQANTVLIGAGSPPLLSIRAGKAIIKKTPNPDTCYHILL